MNQNIEKESDAADAGKKLEEMKARLAEGLEERRKKRKEASEVMSEGRGILRLEKPIEGGGNKITELAYDFNELNGMEYTSAMDTDPNAQQIYRITYRQGLSLFAAAAAKQTDGLDQRDIMERIGVTDAVEGVQLVMLFFSASTRAGQLRLSKR